MLLCLTCVAHGAATLEKAIAGRNAQKQFLTFEKRRQLCACLSYERFHHRDYGPKPGHQLARSAHPCRCLSPVYKQGAAPEAFYLVHSGRAQLFSADKALLKEAVELEHDRHRRVLAELGPGDFFGELELLDHLDAR